MTNGGDRDRLRWSPHSRGAQLQFRQALVIRLSATAFARTIARRGWKPDEDVGLASALGVAPATLAAAVRLAQLQWQLNPAVRVDIFVPVQLREAVLALADKLNLGVGHLVRALAHAVMQTTWEPTHRRDGGWATQTQARSKLRTTKKHVRQHFTGMQPSDRFYHTSVRLSAALVTALDLRSAAYGVTRHQYILRWLADLVDGHLAALPVALVAVNLDQLYDNERAYVLPAGAEKADEQTD